MGNLLEALERKVNGFEHEQKQKHGSFKGFFRDFFTIFWYFSGFLNRTEH